MMLAALLLLFGTSLASVTIATTAPPPPYHRGPWPKNGACPSAFLMDPPGKYRLSPTGCKRSEYAFFDSVTTARDCVELCCGDWSCWAISFYPTGKVGNNSEPNGPGHSCEDDTKPCCVLLNDMHDPVLPSNVSGAQSGMRAKLPARWSSEFTPSTLVTKVSFGDKLYKGSLPRKDKKAGWWHSGEGGSLGDEFPTTWAADGMQYSGAGDNDGGGGKFGGSPLTLWRINGTQPPSAAFALQGVEKPITGAAASTACPIGKGGVPNLKSQSLLALGNKLYWAVACFDYDDPDYSSKGQADKHRGLDPIFNRQRYGVNDTSWIVASSDMGKTWDVEATDFHFFKGRLSSPRFINAGQDYTGAPDPDHVYAVFVGTETNKAFFEQNDAMWLGRVSTTQLLNRSAWTFYAGMVAGTPAWTVDDTIAVSIFRHPLMTAMQQVTYNVGLKRYMMAVWGWVDPNGNPRGQLTVSTTVGPTNWLSGEGNGGGKAGHDRTQLSLWESPQPWGPWSFFHRDDDWQGPDGSSGGYTPVFPPAWISDSGTEMWMVFTQCCPGKIAGPKNNYNFTYQKLTLSSAALKNDDSLALPSAKQLDFQSNHPKGCFFHFGINTFTGQEHGSGDAKQPPSKFTAPADLDTDQWVETCVKLGGTYGVFTAKHEEGMMVR